MINDSTTPPARRSAVTDSLLLLVAVAAVGAWLWRRVRGTAVVDQAPSLDGPLPEESRNVGALADTGA